MIRISEARKKRKLNQSELADRIGIPRPNLSRYENGEREPDIATLIKIAHALQTSIDYICGNSENLELSKNAFLSDVEFNHIKKYRRLSDSNRHAVDIMIDSLLITQDKEKTG